MSVGLAKELGNAFASFSFYLAAKTTFACFWEKSFAVASPIPEDAPVTITTLSLTFMTGLYHFGAKLFSDKKNCIGDVSSRTYFISSIPKSSRSAFVQI